MTRDKEMEERLQKILEFLTKFADSSGYSPSIREIGDEIDVKSTSLVDFYLDKLEERGDILREKHISRSIRVLKPAQRISEAVEQAVVAINEVFSIPIMGRIVAGSPIPVPESSLPYFDSESSVTIARGMLPAREKVDDLFALEVQGDSMIDAMVNDGDIVIMKRTEVAENGDMVAVWLPDVNETTLKYFYKEGDRYRLQPANPTMNPIYIDKKREVQIKGKVVMVIRQVASVAA